MKPSPIASLIISGLVCAAAIGACVVWYGKISSEHADVESLKSQIAEQTAAGKNIAAAQAALSEISGDEATVQS
jgi:FAD/FMN-containing dehydrogenase